MGMPAFNAWWDMITGVGGVDLLALTFDYCGASGRVWGGNPPYALNDFLVMYPKFFGAATTANATLNSPPDASVMVDVLPAGIAIGQLVTGAGIPNGTLVKAFTAGDPSASPPLLPTITLSQNATAAGQISVYTAPPMPIVVIQIYVNLAAASIMQSRWLESWTLGMALFVAHYCTLYLRSESGANQTPAQIAASGLEKGILISKAADGVSAGMQLVAGFDEFGALSETTYGVQLSSLARTIAAGAIWVR